MSVAASMRAFDAGSRISRAAQALREIGWPHLRAALLLGLVAWAFSMLMELPKVLRFVTPLHVVMARGLVDFELRALCLMIAIVIADRMSDEGANRFVTYAVAAVAGCLAGVLLGLSLDVNWAHVEMAARDPHAAGAPPWQRYGTRVTNTVFATLNWLLFGGSAVFLYADRRAARRTEAVLRQAELDRIHRSKLALEARLQAMQARVEPRFLFDTLAHVRHLYERDATAASRMLDDLIAYLRAAMPQMRDTSSTVGQEIALVRAYLDIVRRQRGDRLVVRIEAAPDLEALRMPPMMLLPLTDLMVRRGFDRSQAESFGIACAREHQRIRLSIVTTGFPSIPDDRIDDIRERLAALYGTDANLVARAGAAQTCEVAMEFPCEVAVR